MGGEETLRTEGMTRNDDFNHAFRLVVTYISINETTLRINKSADSPSAYSFRVNETRSRNNTIFGPPPTSSTNAKQTIVTPWDFGGVARPFY